MFRLPIGEDNDGRSFGHIGDVGIVVGANGVSDFD
jgi:hypothetical protein